MGQVPEIEFGKIAFPTDALSLGDIRRRESARFANTITVVQGEEPFGPSLNRLKLGNLEVFWALRNEMQLAQKAFAAALGGPDPNPDDNRLDLILLLNQTYREYGLSSGLQQTRLLVREFEAAAAQQARAARGR